MSTINIINSDCMTINIPKCRLLLTDIPYNEVNQKSNNLRNIDKGDADTATFDLIPFLDHIYHSFDICCIFCGMEQFSTIYDYFFKKNQGTVRCITWCKTNPSPMNGEYVYLSGIELGIWFKKKGTGKLNSKCKKNWFQYPTGRSKLHPTEKNHDLLKDIITSCTNKGDLVVDTCMGSGSTAIVCQQLNRDFFGIELNKQYYSIAKNRLYL